jgi:hypothetical protein
LRPFALFNKLQLLIKKEKKKKGEAIEKLEEVSG